MRFLARRGLSPRVRGKPERVVGVSSSARSIPACAGEADPDEQGEEQ